MKNIVTAFTATNKLTIGNYLGVIKNLINIQDKYNLYVFAANIHAISEFSVPSKIIECKSLLSNTFNLVKILLACGIDPRKTKLFIQSAVHEHIELAYVLLSYTSIGQLERMTQFKTKYKNINNSVIKPTGLLMYPVLMAADILLYSADLVIVGKDQKQHLELCRDIAIGFNKKYGNVFVVPDIKINNNFYKISDLTDSSKKMSKSSSNKNSFISLLDHPEKGYSKIIKAKTDSENKIYFDRDKKPEISNLLLIYSGIENISIKESVEKFRNNDYKDFKKEVANSVFRFLKVIQEKFNSYSDEYINQILANNLVEIRHTANKKMAEVYDKIGLNWKQ